MKFFSYLKSAIVSNKGSPEATPSENQKSNFSILFNSARSLGTAVVKATFAQDSDLFAPFEGRSRFVYAHFYHEKYRTDCRNLDSSSYQMWEKYTFELGKIYLSEGDPERAAYYFEYYLENLPKTSTCIKEASFLLGNIYWNRANRSNADLEKAKKYFTQAATLGDRDARLLLAVIQENQCSYSESPPFTLRSLGEYQKEEHMKQVRAMEEAERMKQQLLQQGNSLDQGKRKFPPNMQPHLETYYSNEKKGKSKASSEDEDPDFQETIREEKEIREEKDFSDALDGKPAHLQAYYRRKQTKKIPTDVSPFYRRVHALVNHYDGIIANTTSWFGQDTLETRKQDLVALKDQLSDRGKAVGYFNDVDLWELCIHIVNQRKPYFFAYAGLLEELQKLINEVIKNRLDINFPNVPEYNENVSLRKEIRRLNKALPERDQRIKTLEEELATQKVEWQKKLDDQIAEANRERQVQIDCLTKLFDDRLATMKLEQEATRLEQEKKSIEMEQRMRELEERFRGNKQVPGEQIETNDEMKGPRSRTQGRSESRRGEPLPPVEPLSNLVDSVTREEPYDNDNRRKAPDPVARQKAGGTTLFSIDVNSKPAGSRPAVSEHTRNPAIPQKKEEGNVILKLLGISF